MINHLQLTKRISYTLILVFGILLLAACSNEADPPGNESAENQSGQAQSLPFEDIGQGDSFIAELENPAVFLAATPEQLAEFSPWLVDNVEALDQLGQTNLETHTLLAIFRGFAPSSGYQIMATDITAENNTLNITVQLSDPAEDQLAATVITYPYHLVSIPNTDFDPGQLTQWTITDTDGNLIGEGSF